MIFKSMRQFKIYYIPNQYEKELREKIESIPELRGQLMAEEILDSFRRKLKGEPDAKIHERISNLERIIKSYGRVWSASDWGIVGRSRC